MKKQGILLTPPCTKQNKWLHFPVILAGITLHCKKLNLSIYLLLTMDWFSHIKMMLLTKYSMAPCVPLALKILTALFPLRLTGLFPVIHRTKPALLSSMDLYCIWKWVGLFQEEATLTTLATEMLGCAQNKEVFPAFTFRLLLKHEPSTEHLKIINRHGPPKKGDRRVKWRWEKLDLLMAQLQIMEDL